MVSQEKAKDVLSDNEGFVTDLNGFLINEKQDDTQKLGDTEIIASKEEINNISNLNKKGMKKSQTVLVPEAEINIEDKSTSENKAFTNKNIENKSNINHKNIDNSNTTITNNIQLANFVKKNQAFSLTSKYSASRNKITNKK